jgi:hypothetical protein
MKKTPKSLSKKLSLHRETILTMEAYDLTRIAGGTETSLPCKTVYPTWCCSANSAC